MNRHEDAAAHTAPRPLLDLAIEGLRIAWDWLRYFDDPEYGEPGAPVSDVLSILDTLEHRHEVTVESKGDGETWEDYAHRLEARIKEQRAEIKNLTALRRVPGDIKARKRIATLERLLGKKELALSKQHDGLHALKAKLAEKESA